MSGQEGFVLVPREPTDIMVVRGDEQAIEVLKDHTFALKEPTLASRVYSAMLAAAPASPQPQGADNQYECECFKCGKHFIGNRVHICPDCRAANPQPSGDGLSDETLREMLAQQMAQHIPSGGAHYVVRDPSKDNLIPIQTYTAQVLAFARAVEARVRSQGDS